MMLKATDNILTHTSKEKNMSEIWSLHHSNQTMQSTLKDTSGHPSRLSTLIWEALYQRKFQNLLKTKNNLFKAHQVYKKTLKQPRQKHQHQERGQENERQNLQTLPLMMKTVQKRNIKEKEKEAKKNDQ
jgi:hypothetical protein